MWQDSFKDELSKIAVRFARYGGRLTSAPVTKTVLESIFERMQLGKIKDVGSIMVEAPVYSKHGGKFKGMRKIDAGPYISTGMPSIKIIKAKNVSKHPRSISTIESSGNDMVADVLKLIKKPAKSHYLPS